MDRKKIPAIVGIAAVIVFFIWGFIEGTYKHAWIIFLVAGLIDVIIAAKKPAADKAPKAQEPAPASEPEVTSAETEEAADDAE